MQVALPLETVAAVAVVVALAGAAMLLALFGGTAASHWRRRRADRVHRELQPLLRQVVVDGSGVQSAARWLSRLPWREQVAQLGDLFAMLSGESRGRVAALADHAGLLARARRWVGSRRWHRRLRGARVLTLAGAGQTEVPALLADPHAEVRAQAADWVAEHGSHDEVAAMLDALAGDPRLADYTLVDCLARAGPRATDSLSSFLERSDVRAAPALRAAARLPDPCFGEAALRWSRTGTPATRAAAVRLLAAIGEPVAVARVRACLDDEAGDVRAAAADALGRLQHWPATAELTAGLSDPVFAVRRAAALALRRLGGPGRLYLRRLLRSDDGFAADMARQVLSLPEEVAA